MSKTTTLGDEGTTPVPAELLEEYGLQPGDVLVWERREDGLHARKRRDVARGLLARDRDDETRKRVAERLAAEVRDLRRRTRFDRSDVGESARGEQT